MPLKTPNLSREQVEFLAILHALGGPLSIDVAGVLAPLLPGPLLDLIDKGKKGRWLAEDDSRRFSLTAEVPQHIHEAIEKASRPKMRQQLVERIYALGLADGIPSIQWLHLLDKAGRSLEAAEHRVRLAHDAFAGNDRETARRHLLAAVEQLYPLCPQDNFDRLYLESVLALSNICFSLGYGFGDIEKFLDRASIIAESRGDRRSRAMINLHLGRLFYFTARRDEALAALSMGFEEIQALGDEDISGRSAVFLGFFHFIKGEHGKALEYFEKAEQAHADAPLGVMTHPMAPFVTGYCACYLGRFHQAIGNLDYHWRMARDRSDPALAATIRAALGTVLVLVGKQKEAMAHLVPAIEEAQVHKSALAVYFAHGGLALDHFLAGRLDEAYRIGKETIQSGKTAGVVRQYASPWILELHYEFHRLGFEPLPGIDFEQELKQAINGINIHLRGVALRLRARERSAKSEEKKKVLADLAESRRCLEESGDPVQLSRTLLEISRLKMRAGRRGEASQLAREALRRLGGYAEEFFPDEFRPLLDEHDEALSPGMGRPDYLRRYLEMIESLYPVESRQEILTKVLSQTNRMFGAERSALFWFPEGRTASRPELRAVCNLSQSEVAADGFKPNMKLVVKAFKSNSPQVSKPSAKPSTGESTQVQSVMCIPVEIAGAVHGVMYFDNSYLPDAFEFLDPETMRQVVRHTNLVVERRLNHLRVTEERNSLASLKTSQARNAAQFIVAQSRIMMDLLKQAEQVSATMSNILILGETGTGKELLARRIHDKSGRAQKAFTVVDSTAIPENLVESQLFGHERGAFTGADQRHIGSIELSHEGTLFLDEIGELPLAAQAKLLRALQERRFNRVGGTSLIHSDFRLVAATNRDLALEVAEGRFRQDLFYRLNVIPLTLPPLRDRKEDIALLAEHFLMHYASKYSRRHLKLSADQKARLRQYTWPGNIRELKNVIERAVLLSTGDQLNFVLPDGIRAETPHPFAGLPSLDELQRRYIAHVIDTAKGRIGGPGGAAEILGMNRTSLYSRMRQLKIAPKALRKGVGTGTAGAGQGPRDAG